MLIARSAAALGLLVVLGGGCSSRSQCGACPFSPAAFILSCGTTDLVNVTVSGPCATPGVDASPSNYVSGQRFDISSPIPGVCRVELTFATGFTYSTDVTFRDVTETSGCFCTDTVPNQTTFTVNNPSTTCVDAGLDAGADAPTDASNEAAVDAMTDAGADG